jgi:CRP-like cAMP-binding protein
MNAQQQSGTSVEEVKSELVGLIAAHPFFKGLSPAHVQMLAGSAMLTSFKAGELIFQEGEMANRFYLIRDGKVVVEAPRREREPVVIQTIGAGEVLGWSWLFAPYYWHFDARAIEPTRAIFFYGTRLREYAEQDHSFGYELMKRTAELVIVRLQAERKRLLESEEKWRR